MANGALVKITKDPYDKETKVNLLHFSSPEIGTGEDGIRFVPAVVDEHHPKSIVTL